MRKRSLLAAVCAAVLCAPVMFTSTGSARDHDDRSQDQWSKHISGTWNFTVSPELPPGVPPFTFSEFITFEVGGGLTETNTLLHANSAASLLLPPPVTGITGSEGHGNWRPGEDPRQIVVTFQKFVFAGPGVTEALDVEVQFSGQHVGRFTGQAVLTLRRENGHELLEGTFTGQFHNIEEVNVFPAGGTLIGRRMRIEPLSTP